MSALAYTIAYWPCAPRLLTLCPGLHICGPRQALAWCALKQVSASRARGQVTCLRAKETPAHGKRDLHTDLGKAELAPAPEQGGTTPRRRPPRYARLDLSRRFLDVPFEQECLPDDPRHAPALCVCVCVCVCVRAAVRVGEGKRRRKVRRGGWWQKSMTGVGNRQHAHALTVHAVTVHAVTARAVVHVHAQGRTQRRSAVFGAKDF